MSVTPRPAGTPKPAIAEAGAHVSRAQRPRPSTPGPAALKAEAERDTDHHTREGLEHRSILRGLMFLALVALLFSLYRAGLGRVFYPGWWRQW